MSKDIKTNENIDETKLDAVAGGTGGNCYFVPDEPIQYKIENKRVWVKCKSLCTSGCSCRGQHRCVNNYHKMDNVAGGIWAPSPVEEYNHRAADKAVRDSGIKDPALEG